MTGYDVYDSCPVTLNGMTNPNVSKTPDADGWRAPNQPDPLPCCEPQQVRSWELENLLQGMKTRIDPLLTLIEAHTAKIKSGLVSSIMIAINNGYLDAASVVNKGTIAPPLPASGKFSTLTGIAGLNDGEIFVFSGHLQSGVSASNPVATIGKTDLTEVYYPVDLNRFYCLSKAQFNSDDWAFQQFFSNAEIDWMIIDTTNYTL